MKEMIGTATVGDSKRPPPVDVAAVARQAAIAPHTLGLVRAPVAGITEAGFQKTVVDYARLLRWRVAHFRTVKVQRRDGSVRYQTPVQADGAGFPDLVLCRGPAVIAAELKVGRGKTSPAQDEWLDAFRAAGVPAFVWTPEMWGEIERTLKGTHGA